MAGTYETVQGDTWDKIAYQVYGDEKYAGYLMENNTCYWNTWYSRAGSLSPHRNWQMR